jgi:DHA2 family lincomycin resistance protein-like MFS transporter
MADAVPTHTTLDIDDAKPARAPELTPAERKRDNLVIGLLIVAAFTVILNETVMGVAIPHLMTDLDITAVAAQWLTTAFLLTMAVVIPITGYLIQRFTTRSIFTTAMVLFSLGTLIAALAPGFPVLLAARVVQASGTAIMLPLLMTTVMTLVPAAERGRRMGNITIVIALAPALGPTISGTILSFANWRFLFWFVLPVALVVLAIGLVRMTNVGERQAGPLDGWSVPLAALGFGGVVFGLSRFGEEAATRDSRIIVASLAIGAVALGAFVWRQLLLQRTDRALLDLRTFRSRAYTIAVLLFVIAMAALFGAIILLPLFMQGVLGLTVLASGLLLLPGGLMFGLMGPVVGRLYDRIGARPLVVPGAVLVSASMWALVLLISESTPWWALLACHVALSAGLSLLFTPLFTVSLGSLPPRLYSHGSATLTTIQQVAGAAGTAALVSTMSAIAVADVAAGATETAGLASGIGAAFTVAATLTTLGIVLALMVPDVQPDPGDGH